MATIGGGEKPVRDALLGSGASQGTGSFAGVEANKLLYQDVQALKEGDLGLSEAEKDQMAQAQQAAAAQQAQAQQEELNRQQMASGGGYSGRYAETARELGAEAGEAGAAAGYEVKFGGRGRSWIRDNSTGEKMMMEKKGRAYILGLWVRTSPTASGFIRQGCEE